MDVRDFVIAVERYYFPNLLLPIPIGGYGRAITTVSHHGPSGKFSSQEISSCLPLLCFPIHFSITKVEAKT